MLQHPALMDRVKDHRENAIHVQQNVGVPETKDQEPLFLKPAITCCIALTLRKCRMLTAVEFDDDTDVEGDEIHDMRPDGCLAPELDSKNLVTTEPSPKLSLCIRRSGAKHSRE